MLIKKQNCKYHLIISHMKWVLVIGSLVLSNHPFWKSCMTGWFFSHEQLKHTNRNECCISRSASSSRRTVTLGKYPQAGEAQQHLASARGPDDGICVTGGKTKASCHEVDVGPCEQSM